MKRKTKILILAANPKDSSRLRLDEEVREIDQGLRRSTYRNRFEMKTRWAVRPGDIRRALLDYEPDIVHFCGHGDKDGLMVEDESGKAVLIQMDALAGLFELFAEKVKCVLLNTRHSELQARAINRHINVVIGMNSEIQHTTAVEFAVGFYDALGAGKSYEEAFEFGKNAGLMKDIAGSFVPVLYKRGAETVPPTKIFLCYSHKDKTLFAEPLARWLKNYGIEVWSDEGSIRPGDSLIDKIKRGIRESDYFVVLLTPNSINSNWVNFELGLAYHEFQSEGLHIIPAIFGNCAIPEFLDTSIYVDFRKFFGYGLRELLLTFGVESRLLSEAETKNLILKMFSPHYREYIKKYVLVRDNSREEAIKEVKKKNLKYLLLGVLLMVLTLSGGLSPLFTYFASQLKPFIFLVLNITGLFITTKYFLPKEAINNYFKLLSKFENLIMDIAPDIHIKDPGALYYEFLGDIEKRFYRIHRIGEDDIGLSRKICKSRYIKYLIIILAAYIGLEIFIKLVAVVKNFVISSRLLTLCLTLFLLLAYKIQINRMGKMFKWRREFEKLGDLFTYRNNREGVNRK